MLIYLLLLLVSGFATTETVPDKFVEQSRKQANYYIEQIQRGNNPDIHYWALAQLGNGNREIDSYIRSRITDRTQNSPGNPYLKSYIKVDGRDTVSGRLSFYQKLVQSGYHGSRSPRLLIELLGSVKQADKRNRLHQNLPPPRFSSDTTNVNYKQVIEKITREESLTSDELPVNSLTFVHFTFLYNKNLTDLLPSSYMEKMNKQWTSLIDPFLEKPKTLFSSIQAASMAKSFFSTRNFGSMHKLSNYLLPNRYLPNSKIKIRIHKGLNFAAFNLGYYDQPIIHQQKYSIPLSRYLNLREEELYFLRHQGIFLYQIGSIKEAQEAYTQTLELAEKYNIDIPKIGLLNNLSLTYYRSGNYEKYQQLLYQALNLAKDENNYEYQFSIYRNLHIFHRKNQNWSTAQDYLTKAQNLVKEFGNIRDLATIYTSTGVYYRDYQSNYSRALTFFNRADSLISSENNFNTYVTLLQEKARLYRDLKRFDKAHHYYSKLRNTALEKKNTTNYLIALIELANLHITRNEYSRAEKLIDELRYYDLDRLKFKYIVKVQKVRAQILYHNKQPDQALALLEKTTKKVLEWARNRTDFETGYWHLDPIFLEIFKVSVDLKIREGKYEKAVRLLDQIKTINDAELYQNPMVKSSLMNKEELAQEKRLDNRLNKLRKRYLHVDQKEKLEIQNKINSLKADKLSLYKGIHKIERRSTLSLRAIQSHLSYDQMVIHFMELEEKLYIAFISNNDIRFEELSFTPSLRKTFDSAISLLAHGETNLNKLYTIYRFLRLDRIPNYINQLTVIPGSYLYQLPIEILPITNPSHKHSFGNANYMIERMKINYITSLENLLEKPSSRKNHQYDYIGYGITNFSGYSESLIPLPYATREVQAIDQRLTHFKNKKIFLNSEATDQSFRKYAPRAKVIHLATHSTISNKEPLFSSIYLQRNDTLDVSAEHSGRFFAYELFDLNLQNEMIMLNSCESGSGPYLEGAGIMGISRSLQYAGARSLVLNLWAVNDKLAADFASEFYSYLNEGLNKSEAMRKTKLFFLSNNNANPHYWGPYMLLGDTSPIIQPSSIRILYAVMAGGGLLLLLGIFGFYHRNSR